MDNPLATTARAAERRMIMNFVHANNNRYKNGEYKPLDHSLQIARDKARSIEPSIKQLQYRDNLYDFCLQKGIVREGFQLGRTKQGISSDIRALITILQKNGLTDEFFAVKTKQQ